MNMHFRYLLTFSLTLTTAMGTEAQIDTSRHSGQADTSRPRLAIFAPLYLDSAFDATGNYRYDKNFPKYFSPGLEFYEGAQLALDSLQKEKTPLSVQLYDTRSGTPLQQILQDSSFQTTGLIIGAVSGVAELQQLAAAANRLHIPFINVNFPNDGGITNNPSLVILNSTLKTHCEGIYRLIQRNYATRPVVFFRRKGAQEDRLKGYFTDIDKTTASVALKIKYVTLDDDFTATALTPYLDSTSETICIAGSLDDLFGTRLCQQLAFLNKSYHTTIIGMPTWDNIDFTQSGYSGEEIIYSTPFYLNPLDSLVKEIDQNFRARYYSRPSDMVFRGYESTWRFGKLLQLHGKDLVGSLGEKKFRVFNDFEITPVFLNRQTMTLDYFENKKLYFIRKLDGNITNVN
jgi:hypothetical protein